MSPAPETDLGIDLDNGWPIHKTACADCNGVGRIVIETGPPHDPCDYIQECEACAGEGFIADGDCDCEACVTLAEAYQDRADMKKAGVL